MNFQPVILGSDALIFLLVASLVAFAIHLSRDPLTRQKWRKVFRSGIGVSAFTIILFYVLIALLDSLHYRQALPASEAMTTDEEMAAGSEVHYSQEVKSLLDWVLADLHSRDEKTYSAPFATRLFVKENMTLADGTTSRAFPPLKYGGQHLESGESVARDVALKSLKVLLIVAVISGVLIWMHRRWIRARQRAANGLLGAPVGRFKSLAQSSGTRFPWLSLYATLITLFLLCFWVLALAPYYHILGTDQVGRDVLYLAIKAIRTGVLIGTLATLLTLPIAIVLGICAGYFKGWVDDAVQYLYTTLSSIPGILLIAASVLLIDVYIETHPGQFTLTSERADFKFLALCFILGMTSWTGLCRLLRAETLKVSQLDYVQAARAFGVSNRRIIGKHILPNVTHIVLIALVLDFSGFVLAEAVLSYIGVGVDPSMASWGNMINEARAELSREPVVWWTVVAAFLLMFVLVLAANLFADRVRDAFDPRSV
jgi:peptide/nickel transport system permease protein